MATRLVLTLREKIALYAGVLISFVLRLLKYKATSLPGKIANKISSSLFQKILLSFDDELLCVTGTNGKSTTTGILANILTLAKRDFVSNLSGANLLSGIQTANINHMHAKSALYEVDEAVLHKITEAKPAKIVVVNNFFRDQLDRFGELVNTINLVQLGARISSDGVLLLNSDDPNTCRLRADNIKYFSVESDGIPHVYANELASCPICNADLKYKARWLGQFGDFYCAVCSYSRPQSDFCAKNVQLKLFSSEFDVYTKDAFLAHVKLNLPGLFNVYNALGAISAAACMNVNTEYIVRGVETYVSLFGRSQKITYKDKEAYVFLIKNPIGSSEVLRLVAADADARLLILLNDDYADGQDVSWIWDANFEALKSIKSAVYAGGRRYSDLALRLKYAGIDDIHYEEGIDNIIKKFFEQNGGNFYILPTYTALLRLTKIFHLHY